jgi:methionine sulfoxide reductase heme-binding subunit
MVLRFFRFTPYQIVVHIGSWIPLLVLLLDWANNHLTANPIQAIEQRSGIIAIDWILLSLACTPFFTLTGFKPALKVRRALGLYAFFYASLHFLAFLGLDYGFNVSYILADFGQKPFIIVGFSALLLLIPLALTSTRASMKRLGKTWQRLHRLTYLVGVLVVIHFLWSVKADIRQPILYGSILAVLLLLRLPKIRRWVSGHRPDFTLLLKLLQRRQLTGTPPDPGLK